MDFDTIRAALGQLQHDADSPHAWQQLASACDGATDLSAGDTANVREAVTVLGAARNAHARRGEWFAVARLIELELPLTEDDQEAIQLAMELGRVYSHELLDESAAEAVYEKILQRHPEEELAAAALAETAEKRAQWADRVSAYAAEA